MNEYNDFFRIDCVYGVKLEEGKLWTGHESQDLHIFVMFG